MPRPVALSQSLVAKGRQCAKLLWWATQEPAAPELAPDAAALAKQTTARRLVERARTLAPDGILIAATAPALHAAMLGSVASSAVAAAFTPALAETRAALATGAVCLYDGAFASQGILVTADLLYRNDSGWTLVTVKSSLRIKDGQLDGVTLQAFVLRACGLAVTRIELLHIDREARAAPTETAPGAPLVRCEDLFVRHDVTERVAARLRPLALALAAQRAALDGPRPERPIGRHCRSPMPCPFRTRCWPALPVHHVSTLYQLNPVPDADPAVWRGRLIAALDERQLSPIQRRQKRAVETGRVVVEPALAAVLAALPQPLGYLDFETLMPAIPRWLDCKPYMTVPVQFSYHGEAGDGVIRHAAWLARDAVDPRPALARALVAACAGAGCILAYHAPFERDCVRQLIACCPDLATPLQAVHDRLVDLLPIVRNHVYHPGFGGSFGMKRVLPALVPELSYAALEIGDGLAASIALERLLLCENPLPPAERACLRRDLLAYCSLDTWGMVELVRTLTALAVSAVLRASAGNGS